MNSSLDCFIRLPIIYLSNDYSPKHIPSIIFGQLTQKPSIRLFSFTFHGTVKHQVIKLIKKCTKCKIM